jgi:hypothetical protein
VLGKKLDNEVIFEVGIEGFWDGNKSAKANLEIKESQNQQFVKCGYETANHMQGSDSVYNTAGGRKTLA